MTQTPPGDSLRIVFAGTPDFAAHHLQALLDSHHQVLAAYTQPDRPAGRGKRLQPGPVKALAAEHGLPVRQPASLKDPGARAELDEWGADIMVVVAYGLLLPQPVLDTPRLGCINVHASLLPRWRGAAPIQRAIEAGDTQTGVTIMQMEAGLDTGPMLLRAPCAIAPDDTAASLHDRLAAEGAPALLAALEQLATGTAQPETQNHSASSYAAKIEKTEALLDWRQSAEQLARRVRAFNPFPVAHTQKAGTQERLRVWHARALPASGIPGRVEEVGDEGVRIGCSQGSLLIETLQKPGKKPLSVAELRRGQPDFLRAGEQLELPTT